MENPRPPPPAIFSGNHHILQNFKSLLVTCVMDSIVSKPITPQQLTFVQHRIQQLFPSLREPDHPPYAWMIENGIRQLNEEGGSNEEAISKFIVGTYKDLPWAHSSLLKHHLRKLCETGNLIQVDNGSYLIVKASTSSKPFSKPDPNLTVVTSPISSFSSGRCHTEYAPSSSPSSSSSSDESFSSDMKERKNKHMRSCAWKRNQQWDEQFGGIEDHSRLNDICDRGCGRGRGRGRDRGRGRGRGQQGCTRSFEHQRMENIVEAENEEVCIDHMGMGLESQNAEIELGDRNIPATEKYQVHERMNKDSPMVIDLDPPEDNVDEKRIDSQEEGKVDRGDNRSKPSNIPWLHGKRKISETGQEYTDEPRRGRSRPHKGRVHSKPTRQPGQGRGRSCKKVLLIEEIGKNNELPEASAMGIVIGEDRFETGEHSRLLADPDPDFLRDLGVCLVNNDYVFPEWSTFGPPPTAETRMTPGETECVSQMEQYDDDMLDKLIEEFPERWTSGPPPTAETRMTPGETECVSQMEQYDDDMLDELIEEVYLESIGETDTENPTTLDNTEVIEPMDTTGNDQLMGEAEVVIEILDDDEGMQCNIQAQSFVDLTNEMDYDPKENESDRNFVGPEVFLNPEKPGHNVIWSYEENYCQQMHVQEQITMTELQVQLENDHSYTIELHDEINGLSIMNATSEMSNADHLNDKQIEGTKHTRNPIQAVLSEKTVQLPLQIMQIMEIDESQKQEESHGIDVQEELEPGRREIIGQRYICSGDCLIIDEENHPECACEVLEEQNKKIEPSEVTTERSRHEELNCILVGEKENPENFTPCDKLKKLENESEQPEQEKMEIEQTGMTDEKTEPEEEPCIVHSENNEIEEFRHDELKLPENLLKPEELRTEHGEQEIGMANHGVQIEELEEIKKFGDEVGSEQNLFHVSEKPSEPSMQNNILENLEQHLNLGVYNVMKQEMEQPQMSNEKSQPEEVPWLVVDAEKNDNEEQYPRGQTQANVHDKEEKWPDGKLKEDEDQELTVLAEMTDEKSQPEEEPCIVVHAENNENEGFRQHDELKISKNDHEEFMLCDEHKIPENLLKPEEMRTEPGEQEIGVQIGELKVMGVETKELRDEIGSEQNLFPVSEKHSELVMRNNILENMMQQHNFGDNVIEQEMELPEIMNNEKIQPGVVPCLVVDAGKNENQYFSQCGVLKLPELETAEEQYPNGQTQANVHDKEKKQPDGEQKEDEKHELKLQPGLLARQVLEIEEYSQLIEQSEETMGPNQDSGVEAESEKNLFPVSSESMMQNESNNMEQQSKSGDWRCVMEQRSDISSPDASSKARPEEDYSSKIELKPEIDKSMSPRLCSQPLSHCEPSQTKGPIDLPSVKMSLESSQCQKVRSRPSKCSLIEAANQDQTRSPEQQEQVPRRSLRLRQARI